jgi:hypothetical protein
MSTDRHWRHPWWWHVRWIAPHWRDRPEVHVRPWWWRLAWTLNDFYSVAMLEPRPVDNGTYDPWSSKPSHVRVRRPSSAERLAAQALERRQRWEPF